MQCGLIGTILLDKRLLIINDDHNRPVIERPKFCGWGEIGQCGIREAQCGHPSGMC